MTPKQREEILEFCRLTGGWYVNNQNSNDRPWGNIANSADHGRYLYQYQPATGVCGGNSVWGQAIAIMGLLALGKRLDWAGDHYRDSAMAAAKYMMTLQILDQRDERLFGALRESTPQWNWIYPRDGATAGMALCVLYKTTKDEEYLYRAQLYADWFLRNALDKDQWPCYEYFLDKKEGNWKTPGIWQVGSGLMFYYLYKLTGEKRYIEEGLKPLIAGYKRLHKEKELLDELGQDDFAAVTAMAACMTYKDAKVVTLVKNRAKTLLGMQDADGSVEGMAGEQMAGLTWQNYIRFVREKKLKVSTAPYEKAIAKAVAFTPSVQERDPRDIRAYGGLYGQTNFAVSRSTIHHRSAGYALIFMLRAEGGVTPAGYDIFDW